MEIIYPPRGNTANTMNATKADFGRLKTNDENMIIILNVLKIKKCKSPVTLLIKKCAQ